MWVRACGSVSLSVCARVRAGAGSGGDAVDGSGAQGGPLFLGPGRLVSILSIRIGFWEPIGPFCHTVSLLWLPAFLLLLALSLSSR